MKLQQSFTTAVKTSILLFSCSCKPFGRRGARGGRLL